MKRFIATQLIKRVNSDIKKGGFLYKLGTQWLIDRNFPIHLYLELSRECNLSCPMCRRQPSENKHMSIDMVERIVNEAKRWGPTSYSLHLFGEPLLHPDIFRVTNLIRKAHKHNVILLTTNGHYLTPDIDADVVFVSMPTFNPNVICRARKYKGKLSVRTFDDAITSRVKWSDLKVQQRKIHNFTDPTHPLTEYNKVERYPCWHPWYTLGITVDGEVIVCCADYTLGTQVGNILDNNLTQIWRGHKVTSIRRYPPTICKTCDVWQFKPNIFFRRQYD